ncbi:MAG TPA: EF-hand domain-containing protein [Planctomycetota bacterium]|nr:EF-hand domain-containing protein [Planctomycetota bacterium]
MKTAAALRLVLLAVALSPAAGCKLVGAGIRAALHAHEKAAVWGYLRPKYDRNGDGRIDRSEYGRDEKAFARLDRDGDGSIGPADFERDVVPPGDLVGPHLLVRAFGPKGAESIDLEELEQGFARLDRDRDGRFTRAEFEAEGWRIAPPFGADFFGSLLEGMDRDGDGAVGVSETRDFFERHDRDGDGRLGMLERALPGKAPRVGAIPVAERQRAPDFTLARDRGEGMVTLSSFAGKRPVALVFGSFT